MKTTAANLIVLIAPLLLLAQTGRGAGDDPAQQINAEVIKRFGGKVTSYTGPDAEEEAHSECDPPPASMGKTVTFVNSSLTDDDLLCLRYVLRDINPAKLDLRFTRVTGASLWHNLDLPKLIDLDLSSTLVNGAGLHELTSFPDLKYLRLNCDRLVLEEMVLFLMAESATSQVQAKHNKLRLYLSHASMTSLLTPIFGASGQTQELLADDWLKGLVEPFVNHPIAFLEGLDISEVGLTYDGLRYLDRFPNLVELSLAGNKKIINDKLETEGKSDETIAFLAQGCRQKITHLDLSRICITDKAMAYIKEYKKLEVLEIANTRVTDIGLLDVVPHNPQLKKLDISNTLTLATKPPSNPGVTPDPTKIQEAISKLEKLSTLNISGTGIDDYGMKAIWKTLQSKTSDIFIGAPFVNRGSLKSLDLANTSVTDEWLMDFDEKGVAFPWLKTINIAGTRMTVGGIARRNGMLRSYPVGKPRNPKAPNPPAKAETTKP